MHFLCDSFMNFEPDDDVCMCNYDVFYLHSDNHAGLVRFFYNIFIQLYCIRYNYAVLLFYCVRIYRPYVCVNRKMAH